MNLRTGKVLVTRRRWDAYMLSAFLIASAVGIVRAIQTGQLGFALLPAGVIPIWLTLRLQTPREGMLASTIRSTPGAIVMLWFGLAALFSMSFLVVIDIYVFGHQFRAPLKPYHALLFSPPFIIMFTGAFFADRIQKRHKLPNDDPKATAVEDPSTNKPMNRSGESGGS